MKILIFAQKSYLSANENLLKNDSKLERQLDSTVTSKYSSG